MSDLKHNEVQDNHPSNLDEPPEIANSQEIPQNENDKPSDKPQANRARKVSFNNGVGYTKKINNKKDATRPKKGNYRPSTSIPREELDVPYDRGWAWMVDLGCFILFFVYISHDNWHSVLLIDYLKEFDITVSVVTIMLSLGSLCYCVATQISTNVLVIKFSTRDVVTSAAIVNFSATLLFAALPNIATFFVANMLKYAAKGITLIATMILVGFYFQRRRGLATTLGLLGMSTSYICMPPLIRYLREEYGFRGCFLIMGGLEMHGVVAALLLRPLTNYKRKTASPEMADVEMEEINSLVEKKYNSQSEDLQSIEKVEQLLPLSQTSITEEPIEETGEMTSDSHFNHENLTKQTENINSQENVNSSDSLKAKLQSDISTDLATASSIRHLEHNDSGNLNVQTARENDVKHLTLKDTLGDNSDEFEKLLTEDNTKKSNSQNDSKNKAANIEQETGSQNTASAHEKLHENNNVTKLHSSSRPFHHVDISALRPTSHASNWSLVTTSTMGSILNIPHVIETQLSSESEEPQPKAKRFQWLRDLFDLSLLKNYLAIMVVVMYVLINASSFSVVYLPTYARRQGVSSPNAAILLTIIGAMDIVGRLFFGFLADLKFLRPHLLIALSSACIGAVTHFIVLLDTFEKFIFFAVMHGLLAGAGHNLTTVLIIDVMGLQHLSKLLSMASMFNSFSFILQHPIHGALIEATGTFVVTYHYIGTCLLLACILLLCEPFIRKLQVAKEKRRELASSDGI